jgi:putative ABC transport system substrate-binding protein
VEVRFDDPPRAAGQETVAVITPAEFETKELWTSLVDELVLDFNIATITVTGATRVGDLGQMLDNTGASCIVIVDNRTLALYRELQGAHPNRVYPPSVVVMTSFLQDVVGSVRGATGIAYEVPLVSSFVALREVASIPVRTVGVVHRRSFSDFVAEQARLAAVEKIELIDVPVSDTPSAADVEYALEGLLNDTGVDAIWVLNDNRLLTSEFISKSWLPVLYDYPVPVVVGVPALVHSEIHFGTLAVLPNHSRLGVQAANIVFDLADADWQLEGHAVELPLSVVTVVDVGHVRANFGLKVGALHKIDQVVE